MSEPRLTTAVIGAGPAGLLFSIVGRILFERRKGDPATWVLRIYDKRETYARTHRLRLDPKPYVEIQRALGDPRVDALLAFLADHAFTPEVNVLEDHLTRLLEELGIRKEVLSVGHGVGEITLPALRKRLDSEGVLGPTTRFTVVGCDSVHSVVCELVRGTVKPIRQTHERVARIRVVGPDMPKRLGAADQVRLSKVLGSVLDYRLNRNGFAEMDLFLSHHEHVLVRALGASPRDPVLLTTNLLGKLRAPLFRAIIDHVGSVAGRQVFVQSTFELEHSIMPKLTFRVSDVDADVFLLGDAGISLPFQRGMACLARCALSLARVHCDLASGANASTAGRYDLEASDITRREVAIIRSRAQIVGLLREIVRVSALLPFPIQSWWLRAPDRDRRLDRFSLWFFLNVGTAAAAFAVAIGGSVLGYLGHSRMGWMAWAAVPFEVAGGIAYHSALAFEGGRHRLTRRAWEVQIAALFAAGLACTARWSLSVATFWWLILAAAFVVGLYAFERVVVRWFARANLVFSDFEG
jgi:hypothetical protein